jgi:ATP-dependent Clp protease protease subunit
MHSSVLDMALAPGRAQKRHMPDEDLQSPPPRGARALVAQHLFAARTVLVFGEVTAELAEAVSSQLFALAAISKEPIRMVINSPGGHVESGDTIHDVIRFIAPEVKILGTGWVASAGALIFAAAERKNRFALPNTRFLLHQPLGGVGGPATDIEIEAAQIIAMRERLNRLFSAATGQSYEKISKDTERNHWMSAQQALEYGLVGRIVERQAQFSDA